MARWSVNLADKDVLLSSMEAETSQRFETDVGDVLICDESGVARIIIDLPNSKIIEITMS